MGLVVPVSAHRPAISMARRVAIINSFWRTLVHLVKATGRALTLLSYLLRRVGRDEDQHAETLLGVVADTMLQAGGRHHGLTRVEHPFLSADLERPLPLEHDVDLVLIAVHMALLGLPGLEAVNVAEKPWRLKQVVLLHLVRRELFKVVQAHNFHEAPSPFPLRGCPLLLRCNGPWERGECVTFDFRSSTTLTIRSTGTKWRSTPSSR